MTVDHFLAGLDERLPPLASGPRRDWWERYLKGTARFRGVTMQQVRSVVDSLWDELDLERQSTARHLRLALACPARPLTEDKLAGILLLAEHAQAGLTLDHLDDLAAPWRTAA